MEVSGQFRAPVALLLGKEPLVPTGYDAGYALEPVWTLCWRENSLPLQEIEPLTQSDHYIMIRTTV
jgi:hypothetical protein